MQQQLTLVRIGAAQGLMLGGLAGIGSVRRAGEMQRREGGPFIPSKLA